MFKHGLLIFVTAFLAFACGGGDSGSSGTPPTIHEVGLFRSTSPDSQTSVVNVGSSYYIAIHASDPDLDMRTVRVEQYHENAASPMYVDTVQLSAQQYSNTLYWKVIYIIGPAGAWRVSFMITDARGNNSNVYWLHATSVRRSKGAQSLPSEDPVAPLFRLHDAKFAISDGNNEFFQTSR